MSLQLSENSKKPYFRQLSEISANDEASGIVSGAGIQYFHRTTASVRCGRHSSSTNNWFSGNYSGDIDTHSRGEI